MGAAESVDTRRAGGGWSQWQQLSSIQGISPIVLAEILDGGQAFRWNRIESSHPDTWQGIWGGNAIRLRLDHSGRIHWSAPEELAPTAAGAVAAYLGAEADLLPRVDALPWRSDAHLRRCIDAFPGLRILKQPFGETLLCFLCSATKQIVQIKQMVALLAERHGRVLSTSTGATLHALPTWQSLAEIPEAKLRACLLGFRAKYIAGTAQFLARNPGWLEDTEQLPYAQAKERLCTLPGVGEKVADCVLLFGAGRLEAFPVDVWILKTMAKRYALEGWTPAQLTRFGQVHFGAFAGLAQQFLFAWERRVGRMEPEGADAGRRKLRAGERTG